MGLVAILQEEGWVELDLLLKLEEKLVNPINVVAEKKDRLKLEKEFQKEFKKLLKKNHAIN